MAMVLSADAAGALVSALMLLQLSSGAMAYPGPYPPGGSCNINGRPTLCLAAPFSDNAVLQREPSQAAITGSVPVGWGIPPMAITVSLTDEEGAGRGANVAVGIRPDRTWKALLPPRPTFGNYSLTAQCTRGCSGANASFKIELLNLTFGDVCEWYHSCGSIAAVNGSLTNGALCDSADVCAGQSNMQLMMDYTFSVNESVAKIKQGEYSNLRLFAGPMNFDFASEIAAWFPPQQYRYSSCTVYSQHTEFSFRNGWRKHSKPHRHLGH
jgi:hypothetical protein